jgi:MEMO1 family protein
MKYRHSIHPKLRPLSIRHHAQDGHSYLLLRDPKQISEDSLLVPQPLAMVLAFCDGAHSSKEMVAAFYRHSGIQLPLTLVEELLTTLDRAFMLENERFVAAHERAVAEYRHAPYRPAALAGLSYPAQKQQLWRLLQDYLEEVDHLEPVAVDWSQPVGLLSPHIDYQRGGAVYAQVWKHAARIAREAELVIFLGTDHSGGNLFTLTRQNYATPYGVLPTAQAIVDQLAQAIGADAAFADELHHRREHSLELVAVWLHHMRAGAPCEIVPILCGGFHEFFRNGATPTQDPVIAKVIEVLRNATQGRRTVVIASGDLAHVGPAFGGAPLTTTGRTTLRTADEALIQQMVNGDAEGFYGAIRQVQDANNVCGVSPIYLTMRTLSVSRRTAVRGQPTGYATCPADNEDTSVVTVGGMVFP